MTRRITDIVAEGQVLGVVGGAAASVAVADDQTAAEVPFTPAGNIAATNVQAALVELDTEKSPVTVPLANLAGSAAAADGQVPTADGVGGVAWETPTGGGGSSTVGGIIGSTIYNPASSVAAATTSSTSVDVDATNLAVTFTAPASGAVWVDFNSYVSGASGTTLAWQIRSGGAVVTSMDQVVAGGAISGRMTGRWKVSGLTSGASVTYTWGHRREYGSGTVYTQFGGATGAASMIVRSA